MAVVIDVADPGAIGAGNIWVQPVEGGPLSIVRTRNADDDGWLETIVGYYDFTNDRLAARVTATADGVLLQANDPSSNSELTVTLGYGTIALQQRDANYAIRNRVELVDHHLNAYHGDVNGTNRGYLELADDYTDLAKLDDQGVQVARVRLQDDGEVAITGTALTFNGNPV